MYAQIPLLTVHQACARMAAGDVTSLTFVCSLQRQQSGCGAHPTPFFFSPEMARPRRGADHWSSSSVKV